MAILLTHHHEDHSNLADFYARKYDCHVYISSKEIDYYDFTCYNLTPVTNERVIEVEEMTISTIFTPGHTAGSLCFLLGNNLFTGDTLFSEGCGECSDTGSNAYEMFSSLQKLKGTIRPNTKIYSGHSFYIQVGRTYEDIYDKNIYLQLMNMDDFVKFRNRTVKERVYKYY